MEIRHVSTGTADFVVRVDEKLCVVFGLFENCNSLFGTHDAIFGSKCFEQTNWVALPDDAADCSSVLFDWGWICIMEVGCKDVSKIESNI